MIFTIFTIGKHKSAEIDNLFNYYLNLSNNKTKLIKVNHKVLTDKTPNLPMNLSDLISNYNFPNNLFVLTEWGTEYTTEGFINKLNNLQNHESEIAFLIGNAYGWQKDLIPSGHELKEARQKGIFKDSNGSNVNVRFISLSQMTFSHEIASLMLVEQIYRFADFLAGGKYGK